MHEFVLSGNRQKKNGVRTLDIAKRLLDFGVHPPTTYFPLIVPEALMIEPTETESKESLDYFISAMLQIADEAENTPEVVTNAPHTTEYKRLDEAGANRNLNLRWRNRLGTGRRLQQTRIRPQTKGPGAIAPGPFSVSDQFDPDVT